MITPAAEGDTTRTTSGTNAADLLLRTVTGGLVQGVAVGSIDTWRGIPYAAPPVGERRFVRPAPIIPWSGVRDASEFGPVAPQTIRRRGQIGPALTPVDEDCLTINVQVPAGSSPVSTPNETGMPVMVFIHGGSYSGGSSRDFSGHGEHFVTTGNVVFVSFNYRLGPLGYLDFTRYATPERPIDSNLGLRDQVAALEWVRDNIAEFGGDPMNVTVFGESAGANAVTTLLGIPATEGLFARAIAQSAPASLVFPKRLAQEWGAEFVEILRERSHTADPAETGATAADLSDLELLLAADPADLVAASTLLQRDNADRHPATFCLAPTVEGDYVPLHPMTAIREGRGRQVPLIIGTNDREGSIFRGRGPLDILPTTAPRIGAMFSRAPSLSKRGMHDAYPTLPARPGSLDFGGDYGFWYPSSVLADSHSQHAQTHVYRYDFAPRLMRLAGFDATHGTEMFALFGRTDLPLVRAMTALGGRDAYADAGKRMRDAWVRFATDGSVDDSWPAYSEDDRQTLIIDTVDRVESDPRRERREAWDEFLPVMKTLW